MGPEFNNLIGCSGLSNVVGFYIIAGLRAMGNK
jgi:hypothetical protein